VVTFAVLRSFLRSDVVARASSGAVQLVTAAGPPSRPSIDSGDTARPRARAGPAR